jgi:pantetheine-phosphate adenylyltransferase
MSIRRAIFPGSFDPITKGHENILRRAAPLFDEIIVAIGVNADKKSMFSLEQRLEWCASVFSDLPNVRVVSYNGLTVDFCKAEDAGWVLRGVRNGGDFQYERTIAQMMKYLDSAVETMILFTDPEFSPISSTVVRDILKNGGDARQFIPDAVSIR